MVETICKRQVSRTATVNILWVISTRHPNHKAKVFCGWGRQYFGKFSDFIISKVRYFIYMCACQALEDSLGHPSTTGVLSRNLLGSRGSSDEILDYFRTTLCFLR